VDYLRKISVPAPGRVTPPGGASWREAEYRKNWRHNSEPRET